MRQASQLTAIRNGAIVATARRQWSYDDVDSKHEKQLRTTAADAQALIAAAQQWIQANPDAG